MNNDLSGKTHKRIAYSIILAFLGTIGMQGIMAMSKAEDILFSNSIFSFFVFSLMLFCLYKIYPNIVKASRRDNIISGVFALLLSVLLHLGSQLEAYDNVKFSDWTLYIRIICFAISIAPLVTTLIIEIPGALFMHTNCLRNQEERSDKRFSYIQVWMIIFIAWMPTFLALYPGAFVYDAQDEYIEVISRTFTTHHPLLHVLSLGGIIHASEYFGLSANVGIAFYVLIQMLIMSAIFAYAIKLFEEWHVNRKILVVIMAFYCLFPLFPMYAVCTAKDGIFTAFLFMIVLLLMDFVKNDINFFSVRNMLLFVASSVLMMLYRNNGVYAYIVLIPFLFFFCRRMTGKNKMIVLMCLSTVIFMGCSFVLKTATNASDSEHQEMLTVPIQQIARTYNYSKDVFTEEELNTLYEVLPEEYLVTYNFRVSDILKSGFNNEAYSGNPGRYRKLWLDIGLRKPLTYVNAWLGTSYGYWYPDAINNVYCGNQMYSFQYGESSYFGFETEPPGVRDSKFKILELFYKSMSLSLFQQKVPVVSMLFAPGFVFLLFLLLLFMCIRNANIIFDKGKVAYDYRIITPLMLVLLLWLTVLLGPTTLVRYVLILWFVVPLYLPLIGELLEEKKH